jgi:hypothetical protein
MQMVGRQIDYLNMSVFYYDLEQRTNSPLIFILSVALALKPVPGWR